MKPGTSVRIIVHELNKYYNTMAENSVMGVIVDYDMFSKMYGVELWTSDQKEKKRVFWFKEEEMVELTSEERARWVAEHMR